MVFYVFLVQTTAKDTFSSMHLSLGRYWPQGSGLKKKKIVTGEFLFIMQQKFPHTVVRQSAGKLCTYTLSWNFRKSPNGTLSPS